MELQKEDGSNFIGPTSRRALEEAELLGLRVVFPEPDELQIDVDNEQATLTFQAQLEILERYVGVVEVKTRPSKSGEPGKYHITVKTKVNVLPMERILLQACMGSDLKREFLSYVQLVNGDPNPVLFLEHKETLALPSAEPKGLLIAPEDDIACDAITYL